MQILWTITTEMPVYCLGVFDSKEEAETFMEENKFESGMLATPLICD